MFEVVKLFLQSKDWKFTVIPGKQVFLLGISGRNGKFQVVVDIREEYQGIICFSICEPNVPEDRKKEVAELITRLNFGRFTGNFEMDFDSGEIRYKTSIYFGDSVLSEKIIEDLVMSSIVSMDISLEGLKAVMFGEKTPVEAVEMIVQHQEEV